MSLWFLTKWYHLYWPPCWRVYSCLPTWRPKLLFAYISAKRCCKRYHITFSTFSLKFKCKICAQKEVINNFKKSHFRHVTSYKLTHFKKMVWVWKTKSLLFCLRYDPLIVFRMQNHITFIFIKSDVTWPLSANGLLLWLYQILLANISVHCCQLYIGLVTFFTYLEATHLSVFHRCSTRFPCNIQ